ncbi:unnamed protein product [Gadus morhua 'NCC']
MTQAHRSALTPRSAARLAPGAPCSGSPHSGVLTVATCYFGSVVPGSRAMTDVQVTRSPRLAVASSRWLPADTALGPACWHPAPTSTSSNTATTSTTVTNTPTSPSTSTTTSTTSSPTSSPTTYTTSSPTTSTTSATTTPACISR